jgi:hypothetical protein
VQLPPFSRHLIPLRSKYSSQNPVLKHPLSIPMKSVIFVTNQPTLINCVLTNLGTPILRTLLTSFILIFGSVNLYHFLKWNFSRHAACYFLSARFKLLSILEGGLSITELVIGFIRDNKNVISPREFLWWMPELE